MPRVIISQNLKKNCLKSIDMDQILQIVLVVIFIATLLNILLKKIGLPTIIGYILTGIILTNLYSMGLHNKEMLDGVSEFGIVFLMFTIGLEFSITALSSMKKEVFLYGFLQLILTSLFLSLISYSFFGIELKSAIIIGSGLSLSSTAIVIKILNEKKDLQRQYGRKALGILLFQDIAVIPLFIMIGIFANSDANISALLWKTAYGAFIVVITIYLAGKYLLNYVLSYITSLKTYEIFIATLLFIVVGSSLVAHYYGFSYSLGAFLAGIMISETKFKYQIEADMIPFRDILLGVFFITVGMQINIATLINYFFIILGITVLIMLLKFAILFFTLNFFTQKRTAFKTALALSQIGEFAIVLFELAHNSSLIGQAYTQILIISVVISMIISPFIINHIRYLADMILKESGIEETGLIDSSNLSNHVVVCGYGRLGKIVSKKLQQRNIKFIIIEHDIRLVKEAINEGVLAIFGNAALPNIQKAVNLKEAVSAIVAIDNEEKLYMVCESLRENSPHLHIIANVKDIHTKELLLKSADHILFEPENTATLLVREALSCRP